MAAGAAVTAAVLALAACSNSGDDASSQAGAATETARAVDSDARPLSDAPTEQEAAAPGSGGSRSGGGPDVGRGGDTQGGVGGLVVAAEAQLAIEARARLEVDDVRDAVNQIRVAVDRAGGRVASANVVYPEPNDNGDDGDDGGDAGMGRPGSATLTLLVPPDRLDSVLGRLEELGDLTSFDQFAEDVGDQLADLETRIENARASVQRTRELLERATSLQDLVFLEDELTRRETDLERLLATQAQLEGRVALSTLTLEIAEQEPADDSDEASGRGILEAFGDGWEAFATAVLTLLVFLAAATPLIVTAAVAVALFFGLRRWRRTATRSSAPGERSNDAATEGADPAGPRAAVSAMSVPGGPEAGEPGSRPG